MLLIAALALVGCSEAGPADVAAMETTDGGASTAYAAVIAVPDCPTPGPIDATACDPSTSFTVDTGIPVSYASGADAGGATYQATVSYYACSYQYIGPVQNHRAGGPVTQECIAGGGVEAITGNSATPLTMVSPESTTWSIGYCVPACPVAT